MLHLPPQMHNSGFLRVPSTPVSAHHRKFSTGGQNYRPMNSSPLASPSTPTPPQVAARRRSQFKVRTPSTPLPTSARSYGYTHARAASSSGGSVFGSGGGGGTAIAEDPQKTFLREKFKARCFERAARARAKAIRGKRYQSEASSDGFDEVMDDDDDEEDDDAIMHDELFRRIMENANRKVRHSFKVSYAHEVGSSFDPDMENVDEWEHELISSSPSSSQASSSQPPEELTPVDLDDEELEAYAEECARRAALADFDDIPQEELFSLSDVEELVETSGHGLEGDDVDVEMMH